MLDHRAAAATRLDEMDRALPAQGERDELSAERRMEVHERVLEPIDPARVGRWRREMDAGALREFEDVAGPVLDELGYERGS